MTNLDKLRILGEALHGPRWMRATARDLGINYRTMLRWDADENRPGDGHVADLLQQAKEKCSTLIATIKRCRSKD